MTGIVKPLTAKNIDSLERSELVNHVLSGVSLIEKEIRLNELQEKPDLAFADKGRIIKIGNLIKLLELLMKECKHDPLTPNILLQAEELLVFLKQLLDSINPQKDTLGQFSAMSRRDIVNVNIRLEKIIAYLEAWKKILKQKIHLPLGNAHTEDCYHPEFPKTYPFKPSYLPDDYRSNFFFEAHIKELCPALTTINISHPYKDLQADYQDSQSLERLTYVNINVDLVSDVAIEEVDNIRALRVHGPSDNKQYPGSYIVLKGGHHRIREIYKRYLEGRVDGNLKILIQLVQLKDLPQWWGKPNIKEEIAKREVLRRKI